jgi:hypothetical protein
MAHPLDRTRRSRCHATDDDSRRGTTRGRMAGVSATCRQHHRTDRDERKASSAPTHRDCHRRSSTTRTARQFPTEWLSPARPRIRLARPHAGHRMVR